MPAVQKKQYVSNMGRYTTVFGKKSFGSANKEGYFQCKIVKPSTGESRSLSMHRLVCVAFNGPPKVNTEVDHKNGDTGDTRAENLEWVTHSENVRRSFEKHPARKAACLGKPTLVRKFGSNDEWVRYASRSDAARAIGITISGRIASVLDDSSGCIQCGGYEFKEAEEHVVCAEVDAVWRAIPTLENCFVSDSGHFKGKDGRVTSGTKRKDGRCIVQVSGKKYTISNLVATAFCDVIGPQPTPAHSVSFKDLTKRDCAAVHNLCWRTPKERILSSYIQGRKHGAEKEKKRVFSRKLDTSTWTLHMSQKECAASLGMSAGTLSHALKHQKNVKGFEFSYEVEEDIEGEEWLQIKEEWLDVLFAMEQEQE